MSLLESSNEYWEFLGQCTQCGHCTQACESLTTANMTLGDIAKSLLDAQRDAGPSNEHATKLAANEHAGGARLLLLHHLQEHLLRA